jgi:hypothetical protein
MCSSLSLSAPEAVSATLACSVYTVQPSDRRHAHSLLLLHSKVVCVLSSSIPCTSTSRVPEPYQSYPTSPPTMPAIHSAIPYSMTLTSPLTIHSSESPPSPHLLPLLPFTAAYRRRLFSTTGSGIDRYSLEIFGGHSNSFRNSLGILWICFSC